MKNLTTLILVCLPFTFFASSSSNIHFLEGNLSEVLQMAVREGKLYFSHFAADWCLPCQWMERHTFTDEPLSAFLEKNFLALRADVDRPEGQALKGQYRVNILPSILVFSSQGQLLGRHEGAMEPEALLEELKAYDRPANRIRATLAAMEEYILSSPQPIFSISRPALIPDELAGAPAAGQAHSYSPPAPAIQQTPTVYFTIQVGVFSSYDNAVRHCSTLETKVSQKTEIALCQLKGQGLYKIFLGHFERQEEAASCLKALRKSNIDGFVKIIDN